MLLTFIRNMERRMFLQVHLNKNRIKNNDNDA